MNEKAAPTAEPVAPPDETKGLATRAAVVGVVAAGVGLFLRSLGKAQEQVVKDLTEKIGRERSKDAIASLSAERQVLDSLMGIELALGTGLLSLGAALVVAAGLVFGFGVRPRRAILVLFPPLLYVAVYSVYMCSPENGIESLAVTGLLGFAILAYATSGPNERARRELAQFRLFPTRVEVFEPEGDSPPYRAAYVKSQLMVQKLLREVSTLPPELARLLPQVGEGRPVGYFQLKKGIAYVAVVEADAYNVSDFCTILLSLEEPAPRFVARPLPIVEGKKVANTGVKFKDDPEFTAEFLVEAAQGTAAADVRAFLSDEVRDELLELPQTWLLVEPHAMAVTVYGAFDADIADRLVTLADVIFAEYGAEGGPSLFEPDGAVDSGGKRIKKKKRKPAEPGASATA